MRDILFRGKGVGNFEWCYGQLVQCPDSVSGWALAKEHYMNQSEWNIYVCDYSEVLNDTIGQYTGLTDYFNDPVYEHDIIEEDGFYGVIKYGSHAPHTSQSEETAVGFYVEWQGDKDGIFRNDIGYWLTIRQCAIRGNIFDNPNLLEVRK